MNKTAYVTFGNHFDLIWRRGWERAYEYQGGRYASYSEVETAILDRALALADAGRGAYQVEQVLTLRMYLRRRPYALDQLRRLGAKGLFEVFGGGEAVIDINMCGFETMARNLASGVRFCQDVLGLPPLMACHCDGFGSSAQFPQVIRGCGFRGLKELSYCLPDKPYWRGLDGSTVYYRANWPGRSYFYDHCYHEPCPVCRGHVPASGCQDCQGTGFDLAQNFYPNLEPLGDADFAEGIAQYAVTSEEMLPPDYLDDLIRRWGKERPGTQYQWGTHRHLAALYQDALALVDAPPADQIASKVENNPAQTGCFVSRIRAKQGARRCENVYYATEAAVAAAAFAGPIAPATLATWQELFLELPLYFFHDAVTGTHQDVAADELLERMAAHEQQVTAFARVVVAAQGSPAAVAPNQTVSAFNPRAEAGAAVRIPLAVADWRAVKPLVAETADGRRFPVTMSCHPFSPPVPLGGGRWINAVGSGTRARPVAGEAFIEAQGLPPLAWTTLTLREAPAPKPVETRELRNDRLRVKLGEHGVDEVADLRTGAVIHAETDFPIGALRLDEDEGDPWNTRKQPAFRRPLAPFTKFLGAAEFAGYSEAWYGGIYEPNLPFGREHDPMIFALEWFLTVRLLDGADRLDFHYEVFWKTTNRRVRAVFPVQAASDTGCYSIPGGWLRRARYDQAETWLWAPNGDWPALEFVAADGKGERAPGWAVVNYGTPAARLEDGRILVSFLRSPGFGHCLERYAQPYPMPTSGIRDPGWHQFTLTLLPHAGAQGMAQLARTAAALNARPFALATAASASLPDARWPRVTSATVELMACKPVFQPAPADVPPNAVVLRLLNQADTSADATLTGAAVGVNIQECDLLEKPRGDRFRLGTGEVRKLTFTAFQARSFLVWREDRR